MIRMTVAIIAVLFVIFDVVVFLSNRRDRLKRTDLHVFVLENLFVIGRTFYRENVRKKRMETKRYYGLCEMYDENYAVLVAKNASFAPLSYFLCGMPLVLGIFAATSKLGIAVLLFLMILSMCFYFDIWLANALSKRHEEVLKDYPTALTKISLLINAGITAAEAFSKVASTGEGLLYSEMRRAVKDTESGMPYGVALDRMVLRCGTKEIRKFASLYKQNMVKGGADFPYLLSELASIAWEDRKNRAKVAGSSASQKLLVPIMLMFTGVLLMIIVPAFTSLL